jgi:hypothetical protein
MNMCFKQIPGFSNYFISDKGVVITTNYPYPKILLPSISKATGYGKTTLVDDVGNTKQVDTHRLVALVWLESWDSNLCVNHKDSNKLNNCVSNLEMCTYQQNTDHAWKSGLMCNRSNAKLDGDKVTNMRSLYFGGYKNLNELAEMFGVSRGHVHAVCTGKKWKNI